jgi:hypothetical protein
MTEGNRLGELAERILARCVATESGCLEWSGAHHPKGYGQIGFRSKVFATHRVAYEAAKGPIPLGYQIDHLCRNPSCCKEASAMPALGQCAECPYKLTGVMAQTGCPNCPNREAA